MVHDNYIRDDTTQSVAITRIVEKLRELLELDERKCFETLYALTPPQVPASGDVLVTVSPGSGQFPQEEQTPASTGLDDQEIPGNLTEETSVDVTIYIRLRTDAEDHQDYILHDSLRGLFPNKRRVLASLVGQDLLLDSETAFLRQPIYAIACSTPEKDDSHGIGWLTITFGLDFDWKLTV
jgi:hypothetical protein